KQPGSARKHVSSAMVLEAVSGGVFVAVAAEIGKNEQCCLPRVLRLALDHLPELSAEAIGAAYAFDIKRVSSRMRNVDIVQRHPQQTRRNLAHKLPHDVYRKLVGTRERLRVGFEVVN